MKQRFDNWIYKYVMKNRMLRSRIMRDAVNQSLDDMIREKRNKYNLERMKEAWNGYFEWFI